MTAEEVIAELIKVPPGTRVTVNCLCTECYMLARDQTVERVEYYPEYQPTGTQPVIPGFVEMWV